MNGKIPNPHSSTQKSYISFLEYVWQFWRSVIGRKFNHTPAWNLLSMKTTRLLFVLLIANFFSLAGGPHSLAAEQISAPDALKAVEAGTMVLLDIRTPEEWKETGIASVAIPLTMHNREFLNGFQKIVSENPDKKIAIICATGVRTQWLQAELAKRGLTPVVDVSEGMMGNRSGPGWIARGMALKKVN